MIPRHRLPTGFLSTHAAWALVGALGLALLLFVAPQHDHHGDRGQSHGWEDGDVVVLDEVPATSPQATERLRIQRHLARVEAEMRARDVSHLSAAQQAERARLLDILAEYRERGEFPRNLDFPGELVPYFVDDRGVHCAVGYLLHRSGRDDVVGHVAGTRNHATVPELADEPELVTWLDESGITLEEATRIQPAYCGIDGLGWGCPTPEPEPEVRRLNGGYLATGIGVATLEAVGLGLNLASLRQGEASGWRGALALVTGAAGVGLGVHGIRNPGDRRSAGFAHLALGLVTAGSGAHALLSRRPDGVRSGGDPFEDEDREANRATRTAADPSRGSGYRVEVSPLLQDRGPERRAGFQFRVRW